MENQQLADASSSSSLAVNPSRPRVSAAVLCVSHSSILMVQHRHHDGTTYWQLPGGGIMSDESPEHAVLRELREETGLDGSIIKQVFTIPYKYGSSTTFLVAVNPAALPILGYDPEEFSFSQQKLIGVAWKAIAYMQTNPEIAELIQHLLDCV